MKTVAMAGDLHFIIIMLIKLWRILFGGIISLIKLLYILY